MFDGSTAVILNGSPLEARPTRELRLDALLAVGLRHDECQFASLLQR